MAIVAVVAFHAFPDVLPGGFVGVDVFFVISGFLITRFIAAEIRDGSFSLARFFVRRARRLLPAAVVCFAGVTAIAAFVLLPDAFWYLGRSLLAAALMFANIFFYRTAGYFSAPALEKPLLHTWSLAVEDQFYLTWPLLLMLVMPRVSLRSFLALIAVISAASLAYAEWHIVKNPEFAFFMLPTRAWELLLGAALALAPLPRNMSAASASLLAGTGLVAIGLSVAFLSAESHFPGLGALPACLGTAMIIASGHVRATALTRALSLRPVVFVGLISYSLYLWHWPLISLLSYRLERALSASEAAVVVIVAVMLAIISWRYVERPFRARHEAGAVVEPASSSPAKWLLPSLSRADKRFALAAAAASACVVMLAMVIKLERGMPERYDGNVRAILVQMVTGNPRRRQCDDHHNIFANDGICNLGRRKAAGSSYEVALFGDSMADHWASLLERYAVDKGLAARQVTNGGCALLFGTEIPASPAAKARECAAYQHEADRFIDANPGLRVAMLSAFWEKWIEQLDGATRAVGAGSGASAAPAPKFDAILATTIRRFTDRGVKVVLIGQVPIYDVIPTRCIISAMQTKADANACGKSRAAGIAEVARSDATLRRVAASLPDVEVFLPSEVICKSSQCALVVDGKLIYRNGGHLNQIGAELLGGYARFPDIRAVHAPP